jgi:hypothetical protein
LGEPGDNPIRLSPCTENGINPRAASPWREVSRLDQRPVVDSPTPFGRAKFGGRGLDTSVAIAKLVDQNGPLRGK